MSEEEHVTKNEASNAPNQPVPPVEASSKTSGGAQEALSRLLDCLVEECHMFEETSEGVKQLDDAPRSSVQAGERRIFMLFKPRSMRKDSTEGRVNPNSTATGQGDRYDYERKYPEDEDGKGMDPNARVWRVYLDEAGHFDADMVENIRDTVDVILVFAGLFSAIVATLVASTITALQPDYGQVIAALLVELIAVQRAMADGNPAVNVNQSPLSFDAEGPFSLSHADRWVNGLWFVSLAISLSTALLAVLVKQWIQAYVSPTFGTPQDQGRMRHFRYMGMQAWHVPLIAGLLPILLHVSLFLFFVGLITLLITLDHIIGGVVGAIGVLAYMVYIITNLLPLYDPQCPYKTPLSSYSYAMMCFCKPAVLKVWNRVVQIVQTSFWPLWQPLWNELAQVMTAVSVRSDIIAWEKQEAENKQSDDDWLAKNEQLDALAQEARLVSLPTRLARQEAMAVRSSGDSLDAEMVGWLCSMSANPSVRTVVAYAVSDLRMDFPPEVLYQLRRSILPHMCSALQECQVSDIIDRAGYRLREGAEKHGYRLLRAHIQLRAHTHHHAILPLDHIHRYFLPTDPFCRCYIKVDQLQDADVCLREPRLLAFRYAQPTGARAAANYSYQTWRSQWAPLGFGDAAQFGIVAPQMSVEEMATMLLSSSTSSPLRIAILQDALLGLIRRWNPDSQDCLFNFNVSDLTAVAKLLERQKALFESAFSEDSTVALPEAMLLAAYLCHFTRPEDVTIRDHRYLGVALGITQHKQRSIFDTNRALCEDLTQHYHARSAVNIIVYVVGACCTTSTMLKDVASQLLPLRELLYEDWRRGWNYAWNFDYILSDTHPLLRDGHLQHLLPTPDTIHAIIAHFDASNPSAVVDILEMILRLVDGLLKCCQQCPSIVAYVQSNNILQAVDVAYRFLDANVTDKVLRPSEDTASFQFISPEKAAPFRIFSLRIYSTILKLPTTIRSALTPAGLVDHHNYVLAHVADFCNWTFACIPHFQKDDILKEVIQAASRDMPYDHFLKEWDDAFGKLPATPFTAGDGGSEECDGVAYFMTKIRDLLDTRGYQPTNPEDQLVLGGVVFNLVRREPDRGRSRFDEASETRQDATVSVGSQPNSLRLARSEPVHPNPTPRPWSLASARVRLGDLFQGTTPRNEGRPSVTLQELNRPRRSNCSARSHPSIHANAPTAEVDGGNCIEELV